MKLCQLRPKIFRKVSRFDPRKRINLKLYSLWVKMALKVCLLLLIVGRNGGLEWPDQLRFAGISNGFQPRHNRAQKRGLDQGEKTQRNFGTRSGKIGNLSIQVGIWNRGAGANFTRNFTEVLKDISLSLHNRTLVVTTILVRRRKNNEISKIFKQFLFRTSPTPCTRKTLKLSKATISLKDITLIWSRPFQTYWVRIWRSNA